MRLKYIVSDTRSLNSFLEVRSHPSAKAACKQENTRLSKQGSLYSAQKWADEKVTRQNRPMRASVFAKKCDETQTKDRLYKIYVILMLRLYTAMDSV